MIDALARPDLLTPQDAGQLFLTLGGSKVVDQRIQEAVQTSQTQEHQVGWVGVVGILLLVLLHSLVELQVVGEQQTVCGCETQHKHHQHYYRHHHCSRSPAGASWDPDGDPAQAPDHPSVGHHRDEQRQEEEGAAEGDEVDPVLPDQIVYDLDVMTGGDVQCSDMMSLFGEDEGHRTSKGQNPHGHTSDDGVAWCPPGQRVDGVDHTEEPVHADASYEQDRAVHVPVEGCGDHTAHERSEYPVVASEVVGDLEGEQDAKDQVSTGQIQHVDHCRLLGPDPPGEGQQGAEVDRHADEDQRVEGRDEDGGHGARQEQQHILRDDLPSWFGCVRLPTNSRIIRFDQIILLSVNNIQAEGFIRDCFVTEAKGPPKVSSTAWRRKYTC